MAETNKRKRSNLLISIAWKALCVLGVSGPAAAITTQDYIDPEDLVDVDNVYSNVGGVIINNPDIPAGFVGICTGTLVNPRTVFTATHCVINSGGSEIYTSDPTGPAFVRFRLNPQGGPPSIFVSDVIQPPGTNDFYSFPDQDFTILALSTPVADIQGAPILLSPITHEFLATMVGYGTFGTGSDPDQGLDFRRRAAQNVVQYLGTFEDFDDDTFGPADYGDSTQLLYFIDFDYVGRTGFFDSPPPGIDYDSLPGDGLFHPTDPVQNEGNTGGGDSGGPLFAHIHGKRYLAGTLSGGLTIWVDDTGPLFDYYGTQTYWNPLFAYSDFIIANNPYKYVAALRGDGDWTDPRHWVQTLDPNYYVLDRHGRPVNGVPRAPHDPDVGFGTFRNIFDILDGGDGLPDSASISATNAVAANNAAVVADSVIVQPDGGGHHGGGGGAQPGSLQGPGSRNFVPNNTDGSPGVEFVNPAQYFDVTLYNYGTTRIRRGEEIEIDHLTIYNDDAALWMAKDATLTVNLETELVIGRLFTDGVLNTRTLVNTFGVIEGGGVINATNGVFNLGGIVSPAADNIYTLTINGDFTQAPFGSMIVDISRGRNDLLLVNGHADMAGNLIVRSSRRLRYGDRYTVVQAESLTGNFDHVFSARTLLFGSAVADGDSIDLVIDAHRLSHFFGADSIFWSLGHALDYARDYHYAALASVFDLVDNVPLDQLGYALPSLTPMSAFTELSMAINYSQSFVRDLAARGEELRAGVRGVSQRSLLAGYRILQSQSARGADDSGLQSQDAPTLDLGDRFGLFVSGYGNLTDVGGEAYGGDRYNPASLSSSSMANMTVGVDYRVNDHFALGVGTTLTHYLARSDQYTPLDHKGYGAMVYAAAWDGAWSLDSYVGIARQDYEMSRLVASGMAPLTADAAPGAVQTLAGLRAGWTANPLKGLAVGPRLSLNYSRIALDAYKEAGAGAFDLMVDGRVIDSLQVETSMEFSYQTLRDDGSAGPFAMFGRVGLVNEVGDGSDMLMARFAAVPEAPFSIARALDRQWFSAATGFSYRFDEKTSFSLEASSDLGRDDFSTTSVQLGFSRRF